MARSQRMSSLNNAAYTDRQLLLLINDIADGDGLVTIEAVAERLKIPRKKGRVPATVAGRMRWMRDLGYLDKVEPQTLGLKSSEYPRYAITSEGRALMGGRLTQALLRELEKGDPGTELLLMREVSRRGYVQGSRVTASAVRREWLHNAAQRARVQ